MAARRHGAVVGMIEEALGSDLMMGFGLPDDNCMRPMRSSTFPATGGIRPTFDSCPSTPVERFRTGGAQPPARYGGGGHRRGC
jgi:hypothetical protein